MATFSNGVYFAWGQRLAPATPYRKVQSRDFHPQALFSGSFMAKFDGNTGTLELAKFLSVRVTWQSTRQGLGASRVFTWNTLARGSRTILGHTYQDDDPVTRKVLIFTQPPNPRYMGEAISNADGLGSYSIPSLPPGTYLLIDYDPALAPGEGPLGHAWVVVP